MRSILIPYIPEGQSLQSPWKDYDNYDYQEYWQSRVRAYEDYVERLALQELLPQKRSSLIDLGANYGRLAIEYRQFERVVLVDGAFSAVQQAYENWKGEHFECTVCDIRETPFPAESFDTVICIRTLHHQSNIKLVFAEATRLVKKNGYFIFNFANKRNLKHILLTFLGLSKRQINNVNPELIGINVYNFHPAYIDLMLKEGGFEKEECIGVGSFRHEILATIIPPRQLAIGEAHLQRAINNPTLSPSVFIRARKL